MKNWKFKCIFFSWDVLSLGTFCPWDILSLGTFCPLGRFVLGTFCPWDVLSLGTFCPWSLSPQNVFSKVYQHLVSLLVQPPLQSELAGVDLPGGGRLPDLDAAIAILEQVYSRPLHILKILYYKQYRYLSKMPPRDQYFTYKIKYPFPCL